MTGAERLALVAEDEPLASMALRAQLEALGFRVVGPARDGDQALALGRCFPVQIAVLDQRMPGRTGLDAATELFRHASTPALLLTGYSRADLPDPVPCPPVFSTLTKPAGMAELKTALDQTLTDFGAWLDSEPGHRRSLHTSLQDRGRIAAAARQLSPSVSDAEAATRFLAQAESHGCSLLDLADQVLEEEGKTA